MIFDTLENVECYAGLGFGLPAALNYLKETDLAKLPLGRTDIIGDDLFVLVQEYTTRPIEQGKWEAHRKYIDIQYVADGLERMGFANTQCMQLGEYVPEKDFVPMTGAANFVDVFAGSFVIFFPEDGHMPCLVADQPQAIRKIVLKVKI
jgi:YhcH/YjgK/YiaL family protein